MSRKLSTQLGIFSRNGCLFLLTVTSWKCMDERSLNTVWEEIKANTNAPDGYKSICLKHLGLNWKKHKNRVKTKYMKPNTTREELLTLFPTEVEVDQWIILVDYWLLPEVEAVATRNSENRKGQVAYPRTGRTPFVDFEENLGLRDRCSIWKFTRGGVESKYDTDDGAADIEAQIRAELEKFPVEEQDIEEVREKVFEMVIGKNGHGHVLCKGVGLCISSINASFSATEYESQVQSEVERLQSKFRDREREREEVHLNKIEELRAEMTEREHALEDRFRRMMEERLGTRVYPAPSREQGQEEE